MTSANVKCAKNLLITSSSILQLKLISSNELCNSLGIDIDIASHPSSLGSNSIIWNVYKPTLPIISWAIELIFGILVQVVFWWYWHSIGAAQLLIHHLVISAALYRSIIWTFLLTSVFTSVLLSSFCCHAAAYCKEMQKHTCHFPAIEQRNYARAWPLPGVTECSNKGDKNFLSMKISPKAEKHSFWGPFFQAHFTTNYSNFYLSSHSKGQNLEMCNIWIFYNKKKGRMETTKKEVRENV